VTWKLKCHFCEVTWSDQTQLRVMETHQRIEHPDEPKIHLDTVWDGPGSPPLPQSNRAGRRKSERARRRRG
jgi:hypothetical protein